MTAPRGSRIDAVARSAAASGIVRPGRPGALAPYDIVTQPRLVAVRAYRPPGRPANANRPASSVIAVRATYGSGQFNVTTARRSGRAGVSSLVIVPVIVPVPVPGGAASRVWASTATSAIAPAVTAGLRST